MRLFRLCATFLAIHSLSCGAGITDRLSAELTFVTFQPATAALGQVDLVSNIAPPPTASTLNSPTGNPAFVDGKLYVSDLGNGRVLGYTGIPSVSGVPATRVLGDVDFISANFPGPSDFELTGPHGVASDGTRLMVADENDFRAVIWNSIPASDGATMDVAVGADTLFVLGSGCIADQISNPRGIAAGSGTLIIPSNTQNRVMIWSPIPAASSTDATVVLGQPNATVCSSNNGGLSASSLSSPFGVWTDGTRLAVADQGNNRVLIWNSIPISNGQPADIVLGQPNMTSNGPGTSQNEMTQPITVASDGDVFAVADSLDNRVLIWNTFPTKNFQPADVVLGQASFTASAANDDDQNSAPDASPSARTLDGPNGLHFYKNSLLVVDSNNNRILVFDKQSQH